MPPLDPPPSPAQLRARRIRATVLTVAALAIVVVLLYVAWFAYVATRRLPPTRLQLAIPAEGHLTFDVATLLSATLSDLTPENRRAHEYFSREAGPLLTGFAPRGEVWFWVEGDRECWLLHLPLRKPQRFFHEKIRVILSTADQARLLPVGAPAPDDGATAWWELRATGLLLSSESTFPPVTISPGAVPGVAAAEYTTTTDHVPAAWEALLPSETIEQIRAAVLQSARWQVTPGGSSPGGFTYQLEGATGTVAWFHPLILTPPEVQP